MFFCFKQKTAYEMLISDWSSDVCSSDLNNTGENRTKTNPSAGFVSTWCNSATLGSTNRSSSQKTTAARVQALWAHYLGFSTIARRSEERRVGKEWVSTGRSRWPP